MSILLPSSDPTIALEARVGDPVGHWKQPRGLAILAHPYGFLGGSLADPVVSLISHTLRELGFRTVRFNSRGVGASQGKGSWTGEAEALDYQAIASASMASFCEKYGDARDCQLLLVGYSAGSLYASALRETPTSPTFQMKKLYLLVSYPLDKIWALSIFNGRKWRERLEGVIQDEGSSTLLIQGTEDQFTGKKSYEAWLMGLAAKAPKPSSLTIVTVEDADHFWRTEVAFTALIQTIQDWLDSVGEGRP